MTLGMTVALYKNFFQKVILVIKHHTELLQQFSSALPVGFVTIQLCTSWMMPHPQTSLAHVCSHSKWEKTHKNYHLCLRTTGPSNENNFGWHNQLTWGIKSKSQYVLAGILCLLVRPIRNSLELISYALKMSESMWECYWLPDLLLHTKFLVFILGMN